jgi:uncharacterized membrane protein
VQESVTIVMDNDVLALSAVLCALAWLGFWIDGTSIGKKVTGVVWVLSGAMLLSNTGVIPFTSRVYDFTGTTLVSLAIPMLLFKANLHRIFRESGVVLLTFTIAGVAVVAGAVLGFYLFDLGEAGAKVAGAYTGGWIGGAVSFLAVSRAVGMTPEQFSSAMGAGSPVSNIALLLLVFIPSMPWARRFIPSRTIAEAQTVRRQETTEQTTAALVPAHVIGVFAASFAICAVSSLLAESVGHPEYAILVISVLALAVANLFPGRMAAVKGDFEIGMILMYVFFAAAGAGTNATAFLANAMHYFVYGLFIIGAHFVIVLSAARLLRIDLADVIVGSGAALVGPAVVAAIATSQGWRHLVAPGILCGVFGKAIGTFVGVALAAFLGWPR